ncbi:hypothetical protein H1230_30080 [Paenibacillus sp. 19GGS1-52]|uniref:hypothetical protein n=1 Tax=Paenibacillus sp. 19GGS1-52 TaxID=2758563 RepID=UPI001EFBDD5F|nr:hypothetical protein [Paenibacillus sp. 19GGS1-52]ULO07137.1 hypothetical protein H1230_30080 [Paenibacillus sp. 19GGS1-52]
MITSILYGLAALIVGIPILRLLIPGFQRQQQLVNLASLVNQSEGQRLRMQQNAIVRSVADHLTKGQGERRSSKQREMYAMLGYPESYEFHLAKALVQAALPGGFALVLAGMVQQVFFAAVGPVLSFLFYWLQMRRIPAAYLQRQNQLIADLPFLISKMITALEVGKPLNVIFQEVSTRCGPTLSTLLKRLVANMGTMSQKDALQVFAQEVNVPVVYDFVSVVNVVAEKGFHEAEEDLNSVKNDLRSLSKLALKERTRGNPGKMNLFYGMVIVHVVVFFFFMLIQMFGAFNSL